MIQLSQLITEAHYSQNNINIAEYVCGFDIKPKNLKVYLTSNLTLYKMLVIIFKLSKDSTACLMF